MLRSAILASLVLCFSGNIAAQALPPIPAGKSAAAGQDSSFRDTSAYRYPALAQTVRDMQNLAYAMQLREYCADRRVPEDFVKEQLARFGRITGRTETCTSLLAY